MSQRINIRCAKCSQTLAVDPASAGKQVRCPKCQSLLAVPVSLAAPAGRTSSGGAQPPSTPRRQTGSSQPQQRPSAPVSAAAPQPKPSASDATGSKVISCPGCAKKMSVKLLAQPGLIRCPGCATEVRVPARPASSQPNVPPSTRPAPITATPAATPAVTPQTGPSVVSSAPQQPAITPSAAAFSQPATTAVGVDLGALDLPSPSVPASSPGKGGGFGGRAQRSSPSAGAGKAFLSWVNEHRWVTLIAFLNLVGVFCAFAVSDVWLLLALQFPVGLVIAGACFLPRYHIVDKVAKAVGAQAAGMGVGGVLVVILLVSAKAILRAARRQGGDFSGFTDPSAIGALLGSLAVFAAFTAIFIVLWKFVGIVRVLAAGYVFEMSIMLLSVTFVGAVRARRENEVDLLHEEFMSGANSRAPVTAEDMMREHERAMADHKKRLEEMRARFRNPGPPQ